MQLFEKEVINKHFGNCNSCKVLSIQETFLPFTGELFYRFKIYNEADDGIYTISVDPKGEKVDDLKLEGDDVSCLSVW